MKHKERRKYVKTSESRCNSIKKLHLSYLLKLFKVKIKHSYLKTTCHILGFRRSRLKSIFVKNSNNFETAWVAKIVSLYSCRVGETAWVDMKRFLVVSQVDC